MAAEHHLLGCLTPSEARGYVGRAFPGPRSRRGPRHVALGPHIRYPIADLDSYIQRAGITDAPRSLPDRAFPRTLPEIVLMDAAARFFAVTLDELIAVWSGLVGPMWVGFNSRARLFLPYFRAIDILDFIGAPVAHRTFDA